MPQAIDQEFDIDENGRIANRARAEWLWNQLKLYAEGVCRIRLSRPKRSTRANRYYWGVVLKATTDAINAAGIATLETVDPTGEVRRTPATAEALHVHFKRKYLPYQTLTIAGEDITLDPTTTTLDSTAFFDYVEAIKQDELTLRLGVYIEEPGMELRSYAIAEPS